MKNTITQFSAVIIALVALTLLMSYTKPAAEEPKNFIVISQVVQGMNFESGKEKFELEVNKKISEGWRLQGGTSAAGSFMLQAMVK